MNKNICIVGVYFGKLPLYFDLWLKSCEKNENIDFLIFTDQRYINLPQNVTLVNFSLDKMKILANKKLGMDVVLNSPYKCCDYKPVYGIIFEDYLVKYDYWGHCDLDLLFGNISIFLEEYRLYDYDKFFLLGHLTLYRNTQEVNKRYMHDGAANDYKKVFSTNENLCFDEFSGLVSIYLKNNYSMFYKRVFADISPIHKRFTLSKSCYIDKPDVNYKYQIFTWENGHVYRYYIDRKEIKKEEFAYIHFRNRKNMRSYLGCSDENAFYIVDDGFIPMSSISIVEAIKKYNCYTPLKEKFDFIQERFKKLYFRIITRLLR